MRFTGQVGACPVCVCVGGALPFLKCVYIALTMIEVNSVKSFNKYFNLDFNTLKLIFIK